MLGTIPRGARPGRRYSERMRGLSAVFPGESEMARRMRALDWSATPLPDPESWPARLRAALGVCLTSRFPMHVWWGPGLTLFYNDAYIAFLGPDKHPAMLAQPARDAWAEIWDTLGPVVARVFTGHEASWSEDVPMFFSRALPQEEVFVSFSFSPIFGEGGWTEGVFCASSETTHAIVGERRLQTLHRLEALSGTRSVREVCADAGKALGHDPHDLPFAAIYLWDGAVGVARLSGSTCAAASRSHPPAIVVAGDAEAAWPLAEVLRTGRAVDVLLADPGVVAGPWPEPVREAIVLPLRGVHDETPAGFLVAGVSTRRPLDDAYRRFVAIAAGQIAAALAGARGSGQAPARIDDAPRVRTAKRLS